MHNKKTRVHCFINDPTLRAEVFDRYTVVGEVQEVLVFSPKRLVESFALLTSQNGDFFI